MLQQVPESGTLSINQTRVGFKTIMYEVVDVVK